MTDTAIPFPEPPSDSDGSNKVSLTSEQLRRAAALDVARNALLSRTGLLGGVSVSNWTIGDLLVVADWVLGTGLDVGPKPRDEYDGPGELPAGLEHVTTFRPSYDPGTIRNTDGHDVTDVLSAAAEDYPEDTLPR